MCQRCVALPALSSLASPLSRRKALRYAAGGVVAIGLPWFPAGRATAQAANVVRAPYGSGICSLGLFLAHADQLAAAEGVTLELIPTATFADHITMVGAGVVDISITPYTSAIALHERGAPIRIVAGGGVEGCGLVARPGFDTPERLRGATLGTFQMDSLEVLAFDWMRAKGLSPQDVRLRYMGSTPEAVEAFKAGALDWISTVEPYVTALLNDVPGSHLLSDGRDIYGPGYCDCVLTAQIDIIERRPDAVMAMIAALMHAQRAHESERETVLGKLVGRYYKTSLDNLHIASARQRVQVDQRDQAEFIMARSESLVAMGYLPRSPRRDLMDWSLLERSIAANRPLWESLELRSTG